MLFSGVRVTADAHSENNILIVIFQRSTEAFIDHVLPSVHDVSGRRIPHEYTPEFGTKVVRITITNRIKREVHDAFLGSLEKVEYLKWRYDLIDKFLTSPQPEVSGRSHPLMKSAHKELEALAAMEKRMYDSGYGYYQGSVYKRVAEAK